MRGVVGNTYTYIDYVKNTEFLPYTGEYWKKVWAQNSLLERFQKKREEKLVTNYQQIGI